MNTDESRLPTPEELMLQLANTEDHFVERKSAGDWKKDALKTIVAFANSAPVGFPSVLFIGVKNDGTVEGLANLDTLQRTFGQEASQAYPPLYYVSRLLKKDDKEFLAVIVPGSANRPHFAGPAYMRRGSETVEASEEAFTELIASRSSKVRELLQWKGKEISLTLVMSEGERRAAGWAVLADCNQFFVTVLLGATTRESIPLENTSICWDNRAKRLELRYRLG